MLKIVVAAILVFAISAAYADSCTNRCVRACYGAPDPESCVIQCIRANCG